jgi:hypothetical protein
MPRIIQWSCEMSSHSVQTEGELEFDDSATDEDIDEAVRTEVFNIFSWGWSDKSS